MTSLGTLTLGKGFANRSQLIVAIGGIAIAAAAIVAALSVALGMVASPAVPGVDDSLNPNQLQRYVREYAPGVDGSLNPNQLQRYVREYAPGAAPAPGQDFGERQRTDD